MMTIGSSFADPEYVFHHISGGYWSFSLRSRVYPVRPGDLVLLPPGLLHIVQGRRTEDALAGGRPEHRVIHFQFVDAPLELASARFVVTPDPFTRRLVAERFELMLKGFRRRVPTPRCVRGH